MNDRTFWRKQLSLLDVERRLFRHPELPAEEELPRVERECETPGCANKQRARGVCGTCYSKLQRAGMLDIGARSAWAL